MAPERQSAEYVAEPRRLLAEIVALRDAWADHGESCQECPCLLCEAWFDQETDLFRKAKQYLVDTTPGSTVKVPTTYACECGRMMANFPLGRQVCCSIYAIPPGASSIQIDGDDAQIGDEILRRVANHPYEQSMDGCMRCGLTKERHP